MEQKKTKKGMAMAVVLIVLFVVTIIGFALASRGTQTLSTAFQSKENTLSLYAAQAGIANEMYDIEENKLTPALPPAGGYTYDSSNNTLLIPQSLPNNALITNQMVWSNYNSSCSGPITASDGTVVPCGMAYLASTGNMSGTTKTIHDMLQVTSGWPFPGAFSNSCGSSLSGNAYTDSYNSSLGSYTATKGKNGNFGTNCNSNGAIALNGNAEIYGAAVVGPGGTAGAPTISTSGNAGYDSARVLPSPISLPPITDPNGGDGSNNITVSSNTSYGNLVPGKYGNISVSGNGNITLECGGTYSISGLSVSGNGEIILDCPADNPVKLYVYNTLSISGNGISNNGENPTGLFMYGMPSLTSASVTGNGEAYYALYAPNAAIQTTGNGDIYGSLVGSVITDSGNANLHYDQALTNDSQANLGITITPLSWISQ